MCLYNMLLLPCSLMVQGHKPGLSCINCSPFPLVGIQIQRLLEWNKINMAIGVCVSSYGWEGEKASLQSEEYSTEQPEAGRKKSGLVSGSSLQLKPSWIPTLKEMENLAHTTLNSDQDT